MEFSVLMSVYKNDKLEFLKTAIESVMHQSIKPTEIVIVVDGPVEAEMTQLLKTYEKEMTCFKVIFLEENLGLGNALEVGLSFCSYNLIARMDADDICVEDRFEKQVRAFQEDEELSIIGGQIEEFIDTIDAIIGIRKVPTENEEIRKYIKSRCPFNHMTVMFRKEEVEKVGGYLEWHFNEDYYLWLRMYLANCKFRNLEDTLVYARVGEEMYQRRGGLHYFRSEAGIQKYMLSHKMIGIFQYVKNVFLRFILQVLMPNKLREWVFRKFARKGAK